MRTFRSGVLISAAAATLLLAASPIQAQGSAPTHLYQMNEGASTNVMRDTGAVPRNGNIGDEVITGARYDGATGYRFPRLEPNKPPAHPEHVVTIPDDPSLDPGSATFSVEIRYRSTNNFGNLIQKGQATTKGGQFKIQLPKGRPSCYYKGSDGQVGAGAPSSIADGRWHVLRCTRTATAVDFYVDGTRVGHKNGSSGYINNTSPWSIGGKTSCDQVKVTCDYFGGDVDYVRLEKG